MLIPGQHLAIALPEGWLLKDNIRRAQWAEEAGYDDLWLADGTGLDGLALAAVLACHTKRIRIGMAVTPAFTRPPAVLAATISVLDQVLPNRFAMGFGSSSEVIVSGWNGLPFAKPLSRVRDMLIVTRSMLKGEKSDFDLETLRSHGYRQPPLERPVPFYVAALRGRMIEMGADKPRARELFRAQFAPYFASGVYHEYLAWLGHGDIAAKAKEGWAEKNRDKTKGALTDELIDEIAAFGTEEECRERISWCAKAGVHTHILTPLPGMTADEVQRTYEAFRGFSPGRGQPAGSAER
jgi:alkanesulfonate monooxygenase SsuD/methylene tetrahydromethanopterin reductase-like flavin-dependent oxidoreductase (luciferase family)